MTQSPVKFPKNRHKTVGGVANTRYSLSIDFDSEMMKKWLSSQFVEKVTKNNLRTISKPHAYLQTMKKTSVKFQKNQHKAVGGVAHTRYPLSIHFDCKNA